MASKGLLKNRVEKVAPLAQASLSTYNQSPRKVRLVTDLVKGKKVADAVAALSFLPKRAALPIKKLIESAVANAKAKGEETEGLRIKDIRVDSAGMLVRYMPRAMGRAFRIHKKSSHVSIVLETTGPVPTRKRRRKADIAVVAESTREAGDAADRIEKPGREREGKAPDRLNIPAPTLARRIFRRKSI